MYRRYLRSVQGLECFLDRRLAFRAVLLRRLQPRANAIAQLSGGLLGKCNRDDTVDLVSAQHQRDNALDESARFTRSGARLDEKRVPERRTY